MRAGWLMAVALGVTGCNAAVSREAYDRDLAGMRQQTDWLEAQKQELEGQRQVCQAQLTQSQSAHSTTIREREQCRGELDGDRKSLGQCRAELERYKDTLAQCTNRGGTCATDLANCQLVRSRAEEELRRLKAEMQVLQRDQKALADTLARVQSGIQKVRERLEGLVKAGKLRVQVRDGLLVISVSSDILFDTGKSGLKSAARPVLAEIAAALRDLPDRRFQIAGHTDDIGSDSVNWPLSTDRALAVLGEMVSLGVPSKMLSAAGFGSYLPVVPNDNAEARAKNRRVEFLLVPDVGALFEGLKTP
jgi:chemotaxis protein MotB